MARQALIQEDRHAALLPEYLDTVGAAQYLSVTRKQLEHWRSGGCGPVYSKLGRLVRYSRRDLDAWMAEKRIRNTSDVAAEP